MRLSLISLVFLTFSVLATPQYPAVEYDEYDDEDVAEDGHFSGESSHSDPSDDASSSLEKRACVLPAAPDLNAVNLVYKTLRELNASPFIQYTTFLAAVAESNFVSLPCSTSPNPANSNYRGIFQLPHSTAAAWGDLGQVKDPVWATRVFVGDAECALANAGGEQSGISAAEVAATVLQINPVKYWSVEWKARPLLEQARKTFEGGGSPPAPPPAPPKQSICKGIEQWRNERWYGKGEKSVKDGHLWSAKENIQWKWPGGVSNKWNDLGVC